MRLKVACGNKKPGNVYNSVIFQHQMFCSTDPLLVFWVSVDVHTASRIPPKLGNTALVQLHWRPPARPEQPSAMAIPSLTHLVLILPDSSLLQSPQQGIRIFLPSLLIQHRQWLIDSICSLSPQDTVALGEGTSGTWRNLAPPPRAVETEVTGLASSDYATNPTCSPFTQSSLGGRLTCAPLHM